MNTPSGGIVPPHDPARLHVINVTELASLSGLSIATLRRKIAQGSAPPVVRLSERRIGFRMSDVADWLAARVEAA